MEKLLNKLISLVETKTIILLKKDNPDLTEINKEIESTKDIIIRKYNQSRL